VKYHCFKCACSNEGGKWCFERLLLWEKRAGFRLFFYAVYKNPVRF